MAELALGVPFTKQFRIVGISLLHVHLHRIGRLDHQPQHAPAAGPPCTVAARAETRADYSDTLGCQQMKGLKSCSTQDDEAPKAHLMGLFDVIF